MGEEPPSAKAEFMMAIAGPLSSIVIGLVFYGIYVTGRGGAIPLAVNGVFGYLGIINGILAIFNLIPAFPLDGGRVLRSIIWGVKGDLQKATRITSQIGKGFGILLIVLGVYQFLIGNFVGGMWWFLIGMFLHGAAKMSYQRMITRQALEGETIRRFMKTDPVTVPFTISIDQLVEDYVYKYHFKMFPVVQNGGKLSGCVTTKDIKKIPREEWGQTKVGDIVETCSPENTIGENEDPVRALSMMNSNGKSRLMVVEKDRLLGIITLKDMLKFLSLKMEIGEHWGSEQ
jgi:CBS domain-containing protein